MTTLENCTTKNMCNWQRALHRLASAFQRPPVEEVKGNRGLAATLAGSATPSIPLQDSSCVGYLPDSELTQPPNTVHQTNSIEQDTTPMNYVDGVLFELESDFDGEDDGNGSEDEVCGILI